LGIYLWIPLRDCYSRFVRPALLNKLNIADGKYIVFTLNRKLLISDENYISNLVHELIAADSKGITIIAPLRYPSAQKVKNVLEDSDYKFNNIHIIEPLSYLTFGYITAHALGIITDSGNVAEEATFNGIPCITLNDYTEHIETVNVGTNVLVGNDFSLYSKYLNDMINCHWKNSSLPECWDGRTADRIVSILLSC
jgi:UDP-N-acetylglucosamine 2-epimerase (non-hydrolysing)